MELSALGVAPPCAACARGPFNIDGHPALMTWSVGSDAMSFRCQECRTLWSRTHRKGGGFAWVAIPERTARSPAQGIEVPPRSDPAPRN